MYRSKEAARPSTAKSGLDRNRPLKLQCWVLGVVAASLLMITAPCSSLQAEEKTEKSPQTNSAAPTKRLAAAVKPEQKVLQVPTLSEAKKITRQWMRKYDYDKDKLMSEEELAQAIYSMFSSPEEKQGRANVNGKSKATSEKKPATSKQKDDMQVAGKEKKPAATKKELASKDRMPKQTN